MGEKLDRSLVENYMNNFFGYGNFDGDYWLVGIEERGGENYQDVKSE
ncbi:MAG: hypothetical protein JJT76_14585 [Clostridiaceae bacterium]|nr:hypothetical protein [Clostridiaceae bacterium]